MEKKSTNKQSNGASKLLRPHPGHHPQARPASRFALIPLLLCCVAGMAQGLDREYANELAKMHGLDQNVRLEHRAALEAKQKESDPKAKALAESRVEELVARMGRQDAANQAALESLVSTRGWPTLDKVGTEGVLTAFLVVQHADLPFQLKYASKVEHSASVGDIPKSNYALFVDRLAMRQNKPQVYGTQIRIQGGVASLHQIENEEEVDKRRSEVGLGPICQYLDRFKAAYGTIAFSKCAKPQDAK
jgi:hypothetical protein